MENIIKDVIKNSVFKHRVAKKTGKGFIRVLHVGSSKLELKGLKLEDLHLIILEYLRDIFGFDEVGSSYYLGIIKKCVNYV